MSDIGMQERIENNKLIAEFMGYNVEYVNNERYFTLDDMLEVLSDEEIHYHSSWDWLMPCIQKILSLDYTMEDMEKYYTIIDNIPDINSTYKSVIDFLKEWYNEQLEELKTKDNKWIK